MSRRSSGASKTLSHALQEIDEKCRVSQWESSIPAIESVEDELDRRCPGNWRLIGKGSFGKVYRCGKDAIKVVPMKDRRTCESIMTEADVPMLLQQQCEINQSECGLTQVKDTKMYFVKNPGQLPGSIKRSTRGKTTTTSNRRSSRRRRVSTTERTSNGAYMVFITMPFVEGGNADQFLDAPYPWTVQSLLHNFRLLNSSLLEMHTQLQFVHSDIKPDNILVAETTASFSSSSSYSPAEDSVLLYLADFGLTCYIGSNNRVSPDLKCSNLGGTPGYIPPSVVLTDNAVSSISSDTFAFGVSMWEIMVGNGFYYSDQDLDVFDSLSQAYRANSKQSLLLSNEFTPQIRLYFWNIWVKRNAELLQRAYRILHDKQTQLKQQHRQEQNEQESDFVNLILSLMLMTNPWESRFRPDSLDLEEILNVDLTANPPRPLRRFLTVNSIKKVRNFLINGQPLTLFDLYFSKWAKQDLAALKQIEGVKNINVSAL